MKTVRQGGVVRLLPRLCGTGEGRKVGSTLAFDGAPVGGSEGFLQLEGSTEG
jgi:hypothetical protein